MHLTALDVAGDAFILRHENKRYMIDGGEGNKRFVNQVCTEGGVSSIDVLVCTHNDKDHAGGVATLLGDGSFPVNEVWLPHVWSLRLPDLLFVPNAFYAELLQGFGDWAEAAIAFQEEKSPVPSSQRYSRRAEDIPPDDEPDRLFPTLEDADIDFPSLEERLEYEREGWGEAGEAAMRALAYEVAPEKVIVDSDDPSPDEQPAMQRWITATLQLSIQQSPSSLETISATRLRSLRGGMGLSFTDKEANSQAYASILLEALISAENIRSIALAAYARGISIRWFEYCGFDGDPQRGDDFLKFINARERRPHYSYSLGALAYTRLTVENEEALVLGGFLPDEKAHDEDEMAVLLSSDSPFEYGSAQLPSGKTILATTPHHGSESNSKAAQQIGREYEHLHWVRSAPGFKKWPGPTVLGMSPATRRACTKCRGAGPNGGWRCQTVRAERNSGTWQWTINTSHCACTKSEVGTQRPTTTCEGRIKDGQGRQCKRKTTNSDGYCYHHRDQS